MSSLCFIFLLLLTRVAIACPSFICFFLKWPHLFWEKGLDNFFEDGLRTFFNKGVRMSGKIKAQDLTWPS